jgi:hypothetical protein
MTQRDNVAVLEVNLVGDQITGVVRFDSARPHPFTGYLELIELLESRRTQVTAQDGKT